MNRVMPLIIALIALGGVLIGAGIQHFYALRQQNQRNLQELRANAYLNFFQGQAKLLESEGARSRGNAREAERLLSEYRLLVKDARFRIGIFGGGSVVSALAKYFGRDPSLGSCPEEWKSDADIYLAMRREAHGDIEKSKVSKGDLYLLLFLCKVPPEQG